jgi:MHS family shikimate/dehydroshikimate transporter-like MFS transporter
MFLLRVDILLLFFYDGMTFASRDSSSEIAAMSRTVTQHELSPTVPVAQRFIPRRAPAKGWIIASAAMGSAIEWYDFYLFGTAATLVFGKLFFPASDPFVATIASLLTITVGTFARPFGSILFGHFGDRLGRKSTLLVTLFLMGAPTAAIGLLPTYASLGVWAPILLVTLRIVQGIAVGGEWGGAVLMCVEHASDGRRSIFGSMPQMGTPLGMMLSVGAFALVSRLDEASFMSWGWRLPFLASIVLVGFGFAIRWKISESPDFAHARSHGKVHRIPFIALMRQKSRSVVLTAGGRLGEVTLFYIATVYLLSYTSGKLGMARSSVLEVIVVAAAISALMMPVWGWVGDRVGPKRVYVAGALLLCLTAMPMFLLVDTGSVAALAVAVIVPLGIIYPMLYGPQPSLYAAQFPAELRYSGISLGASLAGAVGGGLAPVVAAMLVAKTGSGIAVGGYLATAAAISAISATLMISPSKTTSPVE